jgi:hypothetical protein
MTAEGAIDEDEANQEISMNGMRRGSAWIVVAFACIAGVAGCAKEAENPGGAGATSKSGALPATLVLASEPAGAKPVKEVVATAVSGDTVVAIGRVGIAGEERADFRLVDPSLKSCIELADQCETPWDFCCSPAEEQRANSATVEFRDERGEPLSGSVLGLGGVKHLDTVTVKGRVEKDQVGNVTIVATGLFKKS